MKVVCLGVDDDQVEALRAAGHDVVEAEDIGENALRKAGVEDADAFVASGRRYAVQVPVARDVNPGLRTLLVADDAPDYVRGTVDVILSTGVKDRVVEAVEGGEATGEGAKDAGGDGSTGSEG